MIRGQWRPRESDPMDKDDDSESASDSEGDATETEGDAVQRLPIDEDTDEPEIASRKQETDEAMQGLTGALDALSLVPSNVKFGRGGSTGGFRHGAGRGKLAPGIIPVHDNPLLRRGFGRGRGRARGGTGARGAAVVLGATGSQGGHQTFGNAGSTPGVADAPRGARGASGVRGGMRGGRGRGS